MAGVERFDAAWDSESRRGRIEIRARDGETLELEVEAAEFAAVLQLLATDGVTIEGGKIIGARRIP